jgi:ATP-dependent DNA ligase
LSSKSATQVQPDFGYCCLSRRTAEPKEKLPTILPELPAPILFSSHIEENGMDLFRTACEHNLEGIVAKRKDALRRRRRGKVRILDQN